MSYALDALIQVSAHSLTQTANNFHPQPIIKTSKDSYTGLFYIVIVRRYSKKNGRSMLIIKEKDNTNSISENMPLICKALNVLPISRK